MDTGAATFLGGAASPVPISRVGAGRGAPDPPLDLRGTCHKLVHEGLRQHGGLCCSHETTAMPCVLSDESPTNGHRSPTYRFRQLSSLEALGDLAHLEPRQLGTG